MLMAFKCTGDFLKGTKFFDRLKEKIVNHDFERVGKMGVEALRNATPVETGETANSWYYKITRTEERLTIAFCNSNVNKGVPIAIILQYGHGTGTGGWVEGRDYINPAIQPIFDKLLAEAWKEIAR